MPFILLWSAALLVAGLGLTASVQSWRFGRLVARDAGRLFALRGEGEPVHRFAALPSPVRRFAALTGATTHAPVRTLRVRHGGTFRTALDHAPQPVRGEQYFSSDLPGFVWWGRISMAPGAWVDARDACLGGEGNMLVRIESTVTLADARGADIDEGSLLRLLSELAWLPTALFDERYVTWAPIDARSARATLKLRGKEVSATFFFAEDGMLATLEAIRPRGDGTSAPWICRYSEYRTVDGLQVPFAASANWKIDGVTIEYAHWNVEAFEFDRAH